MVYLSSIPSAFWNSIRMKFVCSNDRGDLAPNTWVFSAAHLPLGAVVHFSKQLISMQVCLDNSPCTLSFVYAAINYINK